MLFPKVLRGTSWGFCGSRPARKSLICIFTSSMKDSVLSLFFPHRVLGVLSKVVKDQRSCSVSLFFAAVGASQPWPFLLA